MRPDRQHPRRGRHRPAVVHAQPAPEPDVSRETPPVEEQARLALVEAAESVSDVRGLTKQQVAKLEAATALWVREVRIGGPGPDDTLLYSAPRKPPPPARQPPERTDRGTDTEVRVDRDPSAGAGENSGTGVGVRDEAAPLIVRDWVSAHDPRSRRFDVSDRIKARVPIQDRLWPIGPVFDQGTTPPLSARDASGCVGMAAAAAGNVLGATLTKADALELYDRAQELDHVTGSAYAGTSVLAGMKAGVERGLWAGYLWAFGTRDIAQALLQVGPVVIGIPWFDGMETPAADGVIRPTGAPAGGHAMALVGIRASKPGGPWFVAQQSRGTTVGDNGLVLIHHKDLSKLLAGIGEAAIPVPNGATL